MSQKSIQYLNFTPKIRQRIYVVKSVIFVTYSRTCITDDVIASNCWCCCVGTDAPCSNYVCDFDAVCVVRDGQATCECERCGEEFEPVRSISSAHVPSDV